MKPQPSNAVAISSHTLSGAMKRIRSAKEDVSLEFFAPPILKDAKQTQKTRVLCSMTTAVLEPLSDAFLESNREI